MVSFCTDAWYCGCDKCRVKYSKVLNMDNCIHGKLGGYNCTDCQNNGKVISGQEQPEFDCIGKAEREGQPEPFSLIASDPLAPWLVEMWAAMSRGDIPSALGSFYGMVDTCSIRYTDNPRRQDKINNAEDMAVAMRNWRIEHGLK